MSTSNKHAREIDIEDVISKAKLEQENNNLKVVLDEPVDFICSTEIRDRDFVWDPDKFEGLYTGIPTLDMALKGLKPSEIVFLGAGTNVGKTTVALYIALNLATQGQKVLYMFAEDSRDFIKQLFNSMVNANPQLEAGIENLFIVDENEAIRFVGKREYLVPLATTLRKKGFNWMFLDMLNNLVDPLEDKDFTDIMSKLRQFCNKEKMAVWCNCRFREPRNDFKGVKEQETFSPDNTMFYGKSSNYLYSATTALGLSPCELPSNMEKVKSLSIKIIKSKTALGDWQGTRHRLFHDQNTGRIGQPSQLFPEEFGRDSGWLGAELVSGFTVTGKEPIKNEVPFILEAQIGGSNG